MSKAYMLKQDGDVLIPIDLKDEEQLHNILHTDRLIVSMAESPVSVEQMEAFEHIVIYSDMDAHMMSAMPNLNLYPGEPDGKVLGDVIIAGFSVKNNDFQLVDLDEKEASLLLQRMVNNDVRMEKWQQDFKLRDKCKAEGIEYSLDIVSTAVELTTEDKYMEQMKHALHEMFTMTDETDAKVLQDWFKPDFADSYIVKNGMVLPQFADSFSYDSTSSYPHVFKSFAPHTTAVPGKFAAHGYEVANGDVVEKDYIFDIDAFKVAKKIRDLYSIPVKTQIHELAQVHSDTSVSLIYSDLRDVTFVNAQGHDEKHPELVIEPKSAVKVLSL